MTGIIETDLNECYNDIFDHDLIEFVSQNAIITHNLFSTSSEI